MTTNLIRKNALKLQRLERYSLQTSHRQSNKQLRKCLFRKFSFHVHIPNGQIPRRIMSVMYNPFA